MGFTGPLGEGVGVGEEIPFQVLGLRIQIRDPVRGRHLGREPIDVAEAGLGETDCGLGRGQALDYRDLVGDHFAGNQLVQHFARCHRRVEAVFAGLERGVAEDIDEVQAGQRRV